MPFVQLCYGPYEAFGIIRHRPQRIHGLINYLTQKNYEVEVIPTQHLDRLTVEICDTTVFRCNVTNLLFSAECENDVVCQRAVAAIEEAITRLYSERNVPKHVSVKEGLRYIGTTRKTQDYFTAGVTLLYEIADPHKKSPSDAQYEAVPDQNYDDVSDISSAFGSAIMDSVSCGASLYNDDRSTVLDSRGKRKSVDIPTSNVSGTFVPSAQDGDHPVDDTKHRRREVQQSRSFLVPDDSDDLQYGRLESPHSANSLEGKSDNKIVDSEAEVRLDEHTRNIGSSVFLVSSQWMGNNEYEISVITQARPKQEDASPPENDNMDEDHSNEDNMEKYQQEHKAISFAPNLAVEQQPRDLLNDSDYEIANHMGQE